MFVFMQQVIAVHFVQGLKKGRI